MTDKPNDLLLLAGKILTVIMQAFMVLGAFALIIAFGAVVFARDMINAEIASEFGGAVGAFPTLPMLGVLAMAAACLALIFLFFGKLRSIISTVGEGDPFVPVNAERLSIMAWMLLAVQVIAIPLSGLALLIARWAEPLDNADITIDAGLDLEGILMVIILFILARVFKHGAAMREDLEGTV